MTYKTNQELFDESVAHLRKQGHQSFVGFESGMYYHPDGSKCAIGALISPDAYDPRIENYSVDDLFSMFIDVLEKSRIDYNSYSTESLLIRLQEIHDEVPVAYWEEEFAQCAKAFNLNFN